MRRNSVGAAYFVLALLGSLVLLTMSSQPAVGRVRSVAQQVMLPLQVFFTATRQEVGGAVISFTQIDRLYQSNRHLLQQIAQLKQQVASLHYDAVENQVLQRELHFVRQTHYKVVAAEIIAQDPDGLVQDVTINMGSAAGVQPGMVVVSGLGLVGKVTQVATDSAHVQLIDNPNSRVNATLVHSGLSGTVIGTGGGLRMQILPELGVTAQRGDYVITSGIGQQYPRGLVIGQVASFKGQDQTVEELAVVAPANDFNRLSVVLVILNFHPTNLGG